jgi:hypothetical protein
MGLVRKFCTNNSRASVALEVTFSFNASASELSLPDAAMSTVFPRQRIVGLARGAVRLTPLQRYKSECEAATAWIKHIQNTGIATKEDWLKFSERICAAGARLLKENDVSGTTAGL